MNLDNTKTRIKSRLMIKNTFNLNNSTFSDNSGNPVDGTLCFAPLLNRTYSPIIDLKYMSDLNFRLAISGVNPLDVSLLEKDIFIQFFITTESNDIGSNGDHIKNSFLFTLPIKFNTVTTPLFTNTGNVNLQQHGNFTGTINFTDDQVLFFHDYVFISGTLSTSPGKKVKIFSDLGFVVDPGAIISPDIELITGLPPTFTGTKTHPVYAYSNISSYCSNQESFKYNAEIFDATIAYTPPVIDDINKNKSDILPFISSTINPNPTTGISKLYILNEPKTLYTITIFNVTGTKLYSSQITGEGNPLFEIDLQEYSSGVYFIKVEADGYSPSNYKLIKE